ncbi:MAG: sugar phosphate isomerase/epimerase [Planctomycetaceae bacterium]|nr:sugar phosphate isomerase/epimerase [Planctomycetaceae bacterium]MBT6484912.1 sugar phosphate isomerase/epimerase [Planctomycetaceae bacterium]MBT6495193.1 sugar phosphate isomerase/epimerase [Planctomycetaceae bacterium]
MIRTSFSTLGCPDWGWDELLTFGPQFGYDGVEIRLLERDTDLLARPEFQRSELAARRTELADTGFSVCGLASSVRFDEPGQQERDVQVDVGKAYLELAAELGAKFVRVFGDVLPDDVDATGRDRAIDNIANGLQRLGEFAETLDRTVIIETHGDFSDSQLVQEMMRRVDSPAVGVLWDTHHPWRFFDEALATTLNRLQPWVLHTHWKDSISNPSRQLDEAAGEAAQQAHSLMSGHRHADYVLFGGGQFPALECMQLLRQSSYEGWFSFEWEKMWHPEIETPEVALPLFPKKIKQLWQLAGCTT